jgi:adenosylmethionine-8-amino-7-oxononanoate aminotransferase
MSTTPTAGSSRAAIYDKARQLCFWPLLSPEDVDSGFPLLLEEGSGVRVRDVDGNEYVDLTSSLSRSSTLGYGEARMADAMHDQLRRLHYGGSGPLQSAVTIDLAEKLAELAPGNLTSTVFTGSGSAANEVAIKLAKLYARKRGKPRAYKVVSRWNDFHGTSGSAQEASDWLGVRIPAEPGPPGFSRIPAPTCYRCPFGLEFPSCNLRCADFLADHIEHEGPELVSAFLIEPVAQANGVQVPPPGYLQRVREICDRYEVLFIADEIITGFGRTGKWFGVQHWEVEPDIMTLAKAITAGYIPLAATVVKSDIREAVATFPDVHTFAGHATAAVAALTAIAIYESDGLVDGAAELGKVLNASLRRLEDLDVVGEVRTLGLWGAIDFTADPATRAPFPVSTLRKIVMRARELGVIVSQNGTAIEVSPPFVIGAAELADGIARLERAVREICSGAST